MTGEFRSQFQNERTCKCKHPPESKPRNSRDTRSSTCGEMKRNLVCIDREDGLLLVLGLKTVQFCFGVGDLFLK